MGLERAVDREDGLLQFARYPLRVLVTGPRPVVRARGSGLHSGR